MKEFLFIVGRILGLLFPLKVRLLFLHMGNHIRAGYYSRKANLGKGVVIYPGLRIISPRNVLIGDKTRIGFRATISSWPSSSANNILIRIGRECSIGDDVHITSSNSITIGDNVLIGKMVTITDNSHGECNVNELNLPPNKRAVFSKGEVVIGDKVWIGDKVTILPNVVIGRCVIVGANSVVTKSVPENSIVAGNPAKVIRFFSEDKEQKYRL